MFFASKPFNNFQILKAWHSNPLCAESFKICPCLPPAVSGLLCVAPPIFRLRLAWALCASSENCSRRLQSCARHFAALGCALETASNCRGCISDFSCCHDRTPTRNNLGSKGLFWLRLSWKGRYGSHGVRLLLSWLWSERRQMNVPLCLFSVHLKMGPQPMEWFFAHLGWVFPAQPNQNSLMDMPRDLYSRRF